MKCVDKAGHNLQLVGYMVVAEHLESARPHVAPSGQVAATTIYPYFPAPTVFPAKIEVWQCVKCGYIKLSPAVFSRL